MFSSGDLQWFIISQMKVGDEYNKIIIQILKSSSFYLYLNSLLPKKNQSFVTFGGLDEVPFYIWGSQFYSCCLLIPYIPWFETGIPIFKKCVSIKGGTTELYHSSVISDWQYMTFSD